MALMFAGLAPVVADQENNAGTRADRAALFDYIIEKTTIREAWSPVKNEALQFDPLADMMALRQVVIEADTDEKLYYALVKLSNARKDRHLKVSLVDDGLDVPWLKTGADSNYPDRDAVSLTEVPVKFETDFGREPYGLFIGDTGIAGGRDRPETGDRVISINGRTVADYMALIEPYHRYSTIAGFWKRASQTLHIKTPILPASYYEDQMVLELQGAGGVKTVTLNYVDAGEIEWAGAGQRTYDGFERVMRRGTFDLYRHAGGRSILLFAWHGFRSDLVKDMDEVVTWAAQEGMLDYDIIWDGTQSRGGGRGAYAIQRLSPKAFKTTFGNLKISDIIPAFVAEKRRQYDERRLSDGTRETVGDGAWLIDWLENDVMKGFQAGQAYSSTVPFKLAHAPKWSDGIIHPADFHFRGRMVCLFGPYGGSHLDQFSTIVHDNELCHSIGMPTGGYSNTWEWEEVLTFPASGRPVAEFMWDIGHTIGPRGQVVEGNPAPVDDFVPVTRENYTHYHNELISRALAHLSR